MPIFFFLSGYCSSKSMLSADRIHFGKFMVKKIKTIYVPLLVLRIVLNILTGNTQAMLANPLLFVYNPGDWFLQTRFWGDILFFGYMALCRRFSHPSVKLFLPIVWGALSTYFLDISRVWGPIVHPYLPFYFGVLALCFTFMLAGHLLAQSGLCKTNSDARRLVTGNAVKINGEKIADLEKMIRKADVPDMELLLQSGKKNFKKIIFK